MKSRYLKAIIIPFLIIFFLIVPLTASAISIGFQETSLYPEGNAASIHVSGLGNLFVVDDLQELWQVNPQTGAYVDYYPFGGDNLADITFSPENVLWWSDNATNFGNLDLNTGNTQSWFINIMDFGNEPLNIGPIAYGGSKVWLASWSVTNYGIFSFVPSPPQICLYAFPGNLFAADLLTYDNLLWALDWNANSIFSMDPANGHLIRYALGREIQQKAYLQAAGGMLWWTEDQPGGGLIRFDPQLHVMTVYSLPPGSHARNLTIQDGNIWYTDVTGAFGSLNIGAVTGQSSTLTGQLVAESITPDCHSLPVSTPIPAPIYDSGTFSWTTGESTISNPQAGLTIYDLPETASPFGVGLAGDYLWVSDAGRQKLVRMVLSNLFQPSISLSLTGDSLSKAGDGVSFTVTLENNSSEGTPDMLCSISDPAIAWNKEVTLASGEQDVSVVPFTIPSGFAGDDFVNSASVDCSPTGSADVYSDTANWSIELFQPQINLIKTGDSQSSAGEEVSFTITLQNLSSADSPDMICSISDPDLGFTRNITLASGAMDINILPFTIPDDFSGQEFLNTASATCSPAGFPNVLSDTASWTILINQTEDHQVFLPFIKK